MLHTRIGVAVCLLAVLPACASVSGEPAGEMRGLVDRYAADREALINFYGSEPSGLSLDRRDELGARWLGRLDEVDFDSLDPSERIDWVLLRNHLEHERRRIAHDRARLAETEPMAPFLGSLEELEHARWRLEDVDGRASAQVLAGAAEAASRMKTRVRRTGAVNGPDEGAGTIEITGPVALRTARRIGAVRRRLDDWRDSYAPFDPEFSWWVEEPLAEADKALAEYAAHLRDKIAGAGGDALVGDPIGRDALLDEIAAELIAVTPEEMIAIAEHELAWCEREMEAAARQMGFDGDWKAALAAVKQDTIEPGGQAALVAGQAREAIRFLEDNDLVTVPPLCAELWRLEMLSEREQNQLPFGAYGGQHMEVASPTRTMGHTSKLESMRGNNEHFSRIVVPHELIPGHHLQTFMSRRYAPHRRVFRTPFLAEGWCLHWEMLLWDRGYARSPEDRVGMLLWRMHRCARIIVSLRFHLGEMSPPDMVDFLADRIGLERHGATGEIRRYIGEGYSPLYQCAYMIGGLQLRALHAELVGDGTMTDRRFHDAVLRLGPIPVELIRAELLGLEVQRNWAPGWRFHPQLAAQGS